MNLKTLISKLQKLEKTESGKVSFKIATRGGETISCWQDGDILKEINLISYCIS